MSLSSVSMYFFVDNTTTDKIVFFVSRDGKDWRRHSFVSENEGDLERSFEEVLKKEKIGYEDVAGLAVRVGEGRFTATRLAVTFVNTLALVLKVPVVAAEGEDPENAVELIKKMPVGQYISARYSAEPRIGGVNNDK